jgi:signal transduction histidine kinase/CheY-like chemotaxis protein
VGYRIASAKAAVAASARVPGSDLGANDSRVQTAQMRALYRSSRWVSLGDFAAALTFWITYFVLTGDRAVFVWAGVMHATQMGRVLNALDYQQHDPRGGDPRPWMRRYVAAAALSALAWHSAMWLLLPTPDMASLAMLLLVLLGVGSSGITAIVAWRPVVFAWLLPLLLPIPLALAWYQAPYAPALSVFVLVVLGMNLAFALNQNRMLMRALGARYVNEALIEQLRQQMELAARASRDKSRFLAAASHDLRQPMHALTLFAGALEKRLAGSAEQPLMRNLNECIASLDRSFNAMLDISKLDAGVVESTRHTFAIRDMFRRLHMHFAGQAEAANLQLRFKPGGKMLTTDPQLLERVLGNLIQNAIKYTREGGVVVVARTAGTDISLEVWDTGPGIPESELPRIFDEFYQIDNPQHDRTRGLGMGLAIVKRLVLLLGHTLDVSSRPGRGTLFRIRVPRTDPDGEDGMDGGAETVPSPMGNAGTLLVIDDEATIRESTALLLEQWGYQALVAGSGVEACRIARQHGESIHAIISDLRLRNGETGLQAIRAVQRVLGQPLPALLVTGDTSEEQIQNVHDSGHLVLFKPVRPRALYAALRRLGSTVNPLEP